MAVPPPDELIYPAVVQSLVLLKHLGRSATGRIEAGSEYVEQFEADRCRTWTSSHPVSTGPCARTGPTFTARSALHALTVQTQTLDRQQFTQITPRRIQASKCQIRPAFCQEVLPVEQEGIHECGGWGPDCRAELEPERANDREVDSRGLELLVAQVGVNCCDYFLLDFLDEWEYWLVCD